MQNIAKITALAGGGMQVATRIGGAAADKRIAEIEGNNSIAESLKTVGYENNSEIAREAGSMIEMTKTLIDSTQSSFNSSIISK